MSELSKRIRGSEQQIIPMSGLLFADFQTGSCLSKMRGTAVNGREKCELRRDQLERFVCREKNRDLSSQSDELSLELTMFSEIEEGLQKFFEHFFINQFAILRNGGILIE